MVLLKGPELDDLKIYKKNSNNYKNVSIHYTSHEIYIFADFIIFKLLCNKKNILI